MAAAPVWPGNRVHRQRLALLIHPVHVRECRVHSPNPAHVEQSAGLTRLRERFVLERSEREAAEFMRDLIKKSYNSIATKGYDHFQLLTNGIPY